MQRGSFARLNRLNFWRAEILKIERYVLKVYAFLSQLFMRMHQNLKRERDRKSHDFARSMKLSTLLDLCVSSLRYSLLTLFGKVKLSCDVIVVDHFSHQVIVFE